MMRSLGAPVGGIGDRRPGGLSVTGYDVVRMRRVAGRIRCCRDTGSHRRQRRQRGRLTDAVRRQQNDLQEMHGEEYPGGAAKTHGPASHGRNVTSTQSGENCPTGRNA